MKIAIIFGLVVYIAISCNSPTNFYGSSNRGKSIKSTDIPQIVLENETEKECV